jgi:hypothetical protein
MCFRKIINGIKKALAVLFVAIANCLETVEDDSNVLGEEDRKEKRGISLNLGQGLEGYSYLGPSSYSGRGVNYNRVTPVTEYGT